MQEASKVTVKVRLATLLRRSLYPSRNPMCPISGENRPYAPKQNPDSHHLSPEYQLTIYSPPHLHHHLPP